MTEIPTSIASLEQFLRLPDFKPPLEFLDGRMIQKMSPLLPHSVIQYWLANALNSYAVPRRLGQAYPELRAVFGRSALIPDIAYYTADRAPKFVRRGKAPRITLAPDLVVEILSQGQIAAELRRKLRFSLRHGSRLGWIVSPRREQIQVSRPGREAQVLELGDVISGEEVLPGFSISLDEIFGWLDRP